MIVVRLLFTALLVVLAVFAVSTVWTNYFEAPWTRDAQVRADIVMVAPRVSGPVIELNVADNEVVKKGSVIMTIDPSDYQRAVREAEANVAEAQATADLQGQQAARYSKLDQRDSGAVADVEIANAKLQAQSAEASLQAAKVQLETAKVNLSRTTITSPADGYVTNLLVDVGDYATAGTSLLAIVDQNSFRIEAFFMETKLPSIPVGAAARIRLMAGGPILTGKVEGIARAIFNGQNTSQALLQSPEPSFQWIRLAQRIPIRISIDQRPSNFPLVSGQTATVILEGASDASPQWMLGIGRFVDRLFGWNEVGTGDTVAPNPQPTPPAQPLPQN